MYVWNENTGRLEKINWAVCDLKGSMNLNKLPFLKEIDCSANNIEELNIAELKKLKVLDCSYNNLEELNISNLKKIKYLN